jgi:hypothetical protein
MCARGPWRRVRLAEMQQGFNQNAARSGFSNRSSRRASA